MKNSKVVFSLFCMYLHQSMRGTRLKRSEDKECSVARASFFYQVLWFCAGFSKLDRIQLEQPEYHLDHSKYAGIGAAVLFTAILAFATGSYAWTVAVGQGYGAFAFGLLWAFFIFNVDRLAVNVTGGGPVTSLLPRLALALVIAVVLSAPLEIFILK